MTSTASGAAESWAADALPPDLPTLPQTTETWQPDWIDEDDWQTPGEGAIYVTGVSGRGLILLTAVAAGGCTALDLVLTGGRLTFFFDLCFVVICLTSTMAVRRSDLFTAGVLPPLLYAGVISVLSVTAPKAFEAGSGVANVFLTG